ncbi:MAG TPA: hypothetical protein VGN12_19025 [Pirellulales bacterium]
MTAHFSDGSTRDVTGLTNFASNESAIVAVDPMMAGLVGHVWSFDELFETALKVE